MIKNYFKIAWRSLLKDRGFTFINLIGLACGFAITLLIIQYVEFEMSYENSIPKADSIVRLTIDFMDGDTVTTQDSETYPPIAPKLVAEVPEVDTYTRVYPIGEPNTAIQIGEQQFKVKDIFAVDADFFAMFNYKLIHGNEKYIFQKPNETVLTESTALKYFNRTDVVGEIIKSPGQQGDLLLKVVGVTRDSPSNTHLKFDMLISYPTMIADAEMKRRHSEKEDNWEGNNTYTYVQLASGANYDQFSKSLAAYSQRLIDEKKIKSERVVGQRIADIHLHSKKTFEPDVNGDSKSIFFLLGVAFLVIISAFVNYINLTTSKALDRAKEVGIKKVIGSTKNQLRLQFLIESFFVNLLAGVVALILVWFGKAKFISISGLPESFVLFGDPFFWLLFSSFILLGVFLSGLYPAFVLSSFKPVTVLKGSFSHSTKGVLLRKSLVVFQFAITIILLIQTFTVKEQLDYMRNLDMRANVKHSVVIEAPSQNSTQENYAVFKQNLLKDANIKAVSLSHTVPGQTATSLSTTADITITGVIPDHYYNYYLTFIDDSYISLLDMNILAGANFDEMSTVKKREVIVNEEALERWNIKTPEEAINKKLTFWNNEWTIKGVVENYHQESPKSPFLPMLHLYNNTFRSLATVQFTGGSPSEHVALVKEQYNAVFPGAPFSYFSMDQEYDKQFKADDRFKNVFMTLTGFSILIACLGLFGLASFSVAKRKKEIGVRKVIGASTLNVLILLSKDFLKTISTSVLIAIPITYLFVTNWLDNFAFIIDVYWWLFVVPIVLVFVLVIFSIGIKTIQTATANPIKSLKTE